jgi:hypothetical protein
MTALGQQPHSTIATAARADDGLRAFGNRVRSAFGRHDGFAAFLAYLAVALLWYRGAIAHMESVCACGVAVDSGDNSNFVWTFEWFVHAIGSGQSLLHPTAIWAPSGINLAGTTTPLLLDAIAAPLTVLWGPLPAYNVIMVLAPATSGWAANRLCRHVSGAAWPAFVAGATFGFSSFEVAHLVGQLHLVVMVCPPLILLCAVRALDGTLSSRRYVIYTSLLLIAQALISVEILFTGTLVAAFGLLSFAAVSSQPQRRAIGAKLPQLALPWLVAGLTTLWYALQVLSAPDLAGDLSYKYPTDLLAFLVPIQFTWLAGASFPGVTSHFLGGLTETTAYLGWPLLIIVGHFLVSARRTRAAQLLAVMLAMLTVLTLGPRLYVDGQLVFRMPAGLLANLPLFNRSVFGRFSVYLALTASIALSIWLADRRRSRLLGGLAAVVAVFAVLPNIVAPSTDNVGRWNRPRFFFSHEYTRYLRRGETIMPIPWAYQGESMMWQAQDHMYYKMASGNLLFVPPPGWVNAATVDLWNNTAPAAGDARVLRQFIRRRRVSDVVVLDAYVSRWNRTLRVAGLVAAAPVGGVTIYHFIAPRHEFPPGTSIGRDHPKH